MSGETAGRSVAIGGRGGGRAAEAEENAAADRAAAHVSRPADARVERPAARRRRPAADQRRRDVTGVRRSGMRTRRVAAMGGRAGHRPSWASIGVLFVTRLARTTSSAPTASTAIASPRRSIAVLGFRNLVGTGRRGVALHRIRRDADDGADRRRADPRHRRRERRAHEDRAEVDGDRQLRAGHAGADQEEPRHRPDRRRVLCRRRSGRRTARCASISACRTRRPEKPSRRSATRATKDDLLGLVSRIGSRVRTELGMTVLSAAESAGVRALAAVEHRSDSALRAGARTGTGCSMRSARAICS